MGSFIINHPAIGVPHFRKPPYDTHFPSDLDPPWVDVWAPANVCQIPIQLLTTGAGLTKSPVPVIPKMRGSSTGISIHGGTPKAGWFIEENPIYKWMMTGGTLKKYPSFFGNLHIMVIHGDQQLRIGVLLSITIPYWG